MTKSELRARFQCWCESRAEVERLASLPPSPATDAAFARAQADEVYDRLLYRRLREQYLRENGHNQ